MEKTCYSSAPEKRTLAVSLAPIEHREEGGNRILSGYGAVFYDGTPNTEYTYYDVKERVMPGAFDRALREDDIRSFFNHDANQILGRKGAGTLKLSTDMRGLLYEIIIPNTTAGNDTWESVGRGDVSGASIMFQATSQWVEDGDMWIRNVTEFKPLFEVGPVVFPAYTATTAAARGNAVPEELLRERSEVIARRRRDAEARSRRARIIQIRNT